MKAIFLLGLLFVIGMQCNAQEFEGKIFLVSKTISDTVYYTYTVKGKYVRIDEYDKYRKLNKALVINTLKKTIIAINLAKKVYTTMPSNSFVEVNDNSFEIVKSTNSRTINGYTCYQWRVRNRSENTEVSYWVASDNFAFFGDLLKTLKTYNKSLSFFLKIPGSSGAMPMQVVERNLLRDEKNNITVLDINKVKLSESVFEIPRDYKNVLSGY